TSAIVKVPVTPASWGNWFWKTIRIVGTSLTQTVAAAPSVNVGGSVVVVARGEVVDGATVEDVDGADVEVVVELDGGTAVVVVDVDGPDEVVGGKLVLVD